MHVLAHFRAHVLCAIFDLRGYVWAQSCLNRTTNKNSVPVRAHPCFENVLAIVALSTTKHFPRFQYTDALSACHLIFLLLPDGANL